MSTLTVTNIKATGETASRAVSGVAAAWVNFNGTGTIAIRDSNNVASLTDDGTGKYTINLTNNASNDDYAVTGAISEDDLRATTGSLATARFANNFAAGSFAAQPFQSSGGAALVDCEYIYLTVHGDLA